jgi:hypothetical protein
MAEHENETQAEAGEQQVPQVEPSPSVAWWSRYRGKPCLLQLREVASYVGVTFPNMPLSEQVKNEEGQIVGSRYATTRIIPGVLKDVGEDEGGVRLEFQMADPDPQKPNGRVNIVLYAAAVEFASFPEMSLIATLS